MQTNSHINAEFARGRAAGLQRYAAPRGTYVRGLLRALTPRRRSRPATSTPLAASAVPAAER